MSSSDFFRNFQPLFEAKDPLAAWSKQSKQDGKNATASLKKKIDDEYGSDKKTDPKTAKTDDGKEVYESTSLSALMRKYSDFIAEAELAPPPKEVKIPKDLSKQGYGKQSK